MYFQWNTKQIKKRDKVSKLTNKFLYCCTLTLCKYIKTLPQCHNIEWWKKIKPMTLCTLWCPAIKYTKKTVKIIDFLKIQPSNHKWCHYMQCKY